MQDTLLREIKALQKYKSSYDDLSEKFGQIQQELQLRDQRQSDRFQQLQEKYNQAILLNAELNEELNALRSEQNKVRDEWASQKQKNRRVFKRLQHAAQLLEIREAEFEQSKVQLEQKCSDLQARIASLQGQLDTKDDQAALLNEENLQLRVRMETAIVPRDQYHNLENVRVEYRCSVSTCSRWSRIIKNWYMSAKFLKNPCKQWSANSQ